MAQSSTLGFDSRVSRLMRSPANFSGWVLQTAIAGLILIVVGLLIYRDFIFGNNTLLYTEIGSDSLNVFYPFYVVRSDYLRHVGVLSWSFSVGMGQNLFPYLGSVLLAPVIWLPKAAIAN